MPAEWLYETAARWDTELAAVEAVLADRDTTVRLVAEPGPAGADAVRTAGIGLALRGLRADALVANRVLPEERRGRLARRPRSPSSARRWTSGRRRTTSARSPTSAATRAARRPRPRSPSGCPRVHASGTAARPRSSGPSPTGSPTTASSSGTSRCPAPMREELDLIRRGDELVVTAGPFRRIVPLPSALRRCTVDGAALREDELRIRFAPDPRSVAARPREAGYPRSGTVGRARTVVRSPS